MAARLDGGLARAASIRSPLGDSPPLDDDATEPITGSAVMPQQGAETPIRDPFTPYDIGGPAATLQYEARITSESTSSDTMPASQPGSA